MIRQLTIRIASFKTGDVDADVNGDQVANAMGLGIKRLLFFSGPGLSCALPGGS